MSACCQPQKTKRERLGLFQRTVHSVSSCALFSQEGRDYRWRKHGTSETLIYGSPPEPSGDSSQTAELGRSQLQSGIKVDSVLVRSYKDRDSGLHAVALYYDHAIKILLVLLDSSIVHCFSDVYWYEWDWITNISAGKTKVLTLPTNLLLRYLEDKPKQILTAYYPDFFSLFDKCLNSE